jgi:hypothetical protein
MAVTIKSVFETVAADVAIDAALLKRIHDYQVAFVNRNPDHLAFFGGNLMGVHPMRFRPQDREAWFDDVLDIDELALSDGIADVAAIDAEWKRANDVMNLSCVWLLHAIMMSKLSPAQKEQGCLDTLLILQYKFLGSLMAWYFRFPADEAVMLAVYARLSKKYALKAAGSWTNLLHMRAMEILSPKSVHYQTFMQFNRDPSIVYMVTDIQGRLREIVKSMTAVFYKVREEGARILSENSVMDIDGTMVLKDKTRNYSTLIRYGLSVVDDRNSFVKAELVKVIADAMHTMPPKLFVETLEWMAVNHTGKYAERTDRLISETLIYAFNLIASDRALLGKASGVTPLLAKLRALYMASRMPESSPLALTKQLSEDIVTDAVRTRNGSVIASIRTAVQLYIVLRTVAMPHYQG